MGSSLDWQAIISAALGGVGVTGVAKYFLEKSARQLEQLPDKLSQINIQITAINIQLNEITHMRKILQEHDRDISALKIVQRLQSIQEEKKKTE